MMFLKMCICAKKTLLACSCAMYMVRFLTLNKFETGVISVVNGNGNGGKLGDFSQ